jgi:hypothetical protein
LFRNYFNVSPGIVYAMLLASGQNASPNNTVGAGRLLMPASHKQFWGSVTIGHGQVVNIPIDVCGGNPNTLDAATWWPETFEQQHNQVKLQLLDPAGVVRATGNVGSSVFQRARVSGPLVGNNWTLRLTGQSLPVGVNQTVYWAALHAFQDFVCSSPG